MRRLFVFPILLALAACEFPQAPVIPGPGTPFRSWRIEGLANDPDFDRPLESDTSSANRLIHRFADLGPMALNPQGAFPNALGQVLSNETGKTYWVSVEAPTSAAGLTAPDSLIGGEVV